MSSKAKSPVLDRLLVPLSKCLTPESATRLLKLKADPELQKLVNDLGRKCNEGTLTATEQADYANYLSFGTFIALLKANARKMVSNGVGN